MAAPKNTSFVVQNAPTGTYSDIVSFGLQAYFLANNTQTGLNELYRTYDTYSNTTLTSITSTLVTGPTAVAPWTNPQKLMISNGLLYIVDKLPSGNLGIFELGLSNNQTSGNASFSVTQIVGYNFSSILDLNIQNGNIFSKDHRAEILVYPFLQFHKTLQHLPFQRPLLSLSMLPPALCYRRTL